MGFRDEAENAAIFKDMAAPNGRDRAGVPSFQSQEPLGDIRDLRHPIRSARLTRQHRPCPARSYPHGRLVLRSDLADRQFLAVPLRRAAVNDQRTVVEDRTDG